MKRWHLVAFMITAGTAVVIRPSAAQSPGSSQPYQPAVPSSNTVNAYGAYPGYYGGGTVAGSAMNGMANVISAKGNYNLSTSAAAVNMTQAQKNEIQNRQQYENTYFQMREANRAYRKAEEGPRPTEEQLARLAREGAPQAVSARDVDPVSGSIQWPAVLQEPTFAADRAELQQLSATQASHGSLGIADQVAARKTIETMFTGLKSQISDVPPPDYLASRDFLRSLIYSLAQSQLE
jgi:hypothetical protein